MSFVIINKATNTPWIHETAETREAVKDIILKWVDVDYIEHTYIKAEDFNKLSLDEMVAMIECYIIEE